MRKAHIDFNMMKEQIEIIDIMADTADEEDANMLDGVANFLDMIVKGDIICFFKEHNGTIE